MISNRREQAQRQRSTRGVFSYYVRALAMGLPAICFGLTIQPWIHLGHTMRSGAGDFRAFYAAAELVRDGRGVELYNAATQQQMQDATISQGNVPLLFYHLAYEAVLFLPLTYLPYRAAFITWFVLNIGLVILCYMLLHSYLSNTSALWEGLPVAVFVGFIPVSVALLQGQDSLVLLTIFIFSFLALKDRSDLRAGLITGLAMFKFNLALPIAALFLLWGKFRFLTGFVISAFAGAAASWFLVRRGGMRLFIHILSGEAAVQYDAPPAYMANLRGLVYVAVGRLVSQSMLQVMIALTSICLLLIVWRFCSCSTTSRYLAAVLTASLLSYHFLSHDMSILLLPIVVLLAEHMADEKWLLILAVVFTAPALDMIYRCWMFLGAFAILALLIKLLSPQLFPLLARATEIGDLG